MNYKVKMRILMVCMGNICRSPIAATVARVELARAGIAAEVDSAGTEDYHIGDRADRRAIEVAEAHGYALAAHRARQVRGEDFETFDHLFAMDRVNLRALQRFRPAQRGIEPVLLLGEAEVPDPYYGTMQDFEHVVSLARTGVAALLARLREPPRQA